MGESESESERAGERGDKGRWRKCGLKISEQLIYKNTKNADQRKKGTETETERVTPGARGREGGRERAEARD